MTRTHAARRPRRPRSRKMTGTGTATGATRITHHIVSYVTVHHARAKTIRAKTARKTR